MTPKPSNTPDRRQQEADALGLSPEELIEIEQNRKDQSEADSLGIEPWEVRMRRSGATEPEIESHRKKLRQATQDIIGE
jgi:hypothetical protein